MKKAAVFRTVAFFNYLLERVVLRFWLLGVYHLVPGFPQLEQVFFYRVLCGQNDDQNSQESNYDVLQVHIDKHRQNPAQSFG